MACQRASGGGAGQVRVYLRTKGGRKRHMAGSRGLAQMNENFHMALDRVAIDDVNSSPISFWYH